MITVTTNMAEVTERMTRKYKSLTEPNGAQRDKLLRTVATTIGAIMKHRIHTEGKKSDGTNIGEYNDTDPIYVNPKNSPRNITPEGKPKKVGTFKSGKKKGQDKIQGNKKNKTKYFSSYKSFRDHIGRDTSKINLSLSGSGMESDFGISAEDPIKTNTGYGLGFKNVLNALKAEGHVSRFGQIYVLSESEKTTLRETAEDFIFRMEQE